MKLDFVEIEGFRGFHQRTSEFPSGFAVIAGRNGVGKSTILDAVDFAITGNINKYSVENAHGGGLLDHIWWVGDAPAEQHFVRVGFVDGDGERFSVTRHRYHTDPEGLSEVMQRLCTTSASGSDAAGAGSMMQSTLIRDELISTFSLDLPGQARFNAVRSAIGAVVGPDHAQRTGAIHGQAKAALADEQSRAKELQAELGRLLSQLTEARPASQRIWGPHKPVSTTWG